MDIKRQILIASIVVPQSINVPSAPTAPSAASNGVPSLASQQPAIAEQPTATVNTSFVTVETDLATIKINTLGGGIENLTLKDELRKADTPDEGFQLLKNTPTDVFISQSGLIGNSGTYPNHNTQYTVEKSNYELGAGTTVEVPFYWTSPEGNIFVKKFVFNKDSYVIDVDYQITNSLAEPWTGYLYAQFKRTQPLDKKKGSFMQLPSFMGGVKYTSENKYDKISFKDIKEDNLAISTGDGWVGMLQHYFTGLWMPETSDNTEAYKFYSRYTDGVQPEYIMGYNSLVPLELQAGEQGTLSTKAFVGPKVQSRLKGLEKSSDAEGLSLSVDYGWLTVIADPLFWMLDKIHSVVKNWGWSIIILTILIKLAFYPLSAAGYKSMAKMKKFQPRIQTLKERYGDDKAGLQQEMMKLYKEEKVNPAGGCLPMLIQIPVFIALYYVLLESVELRHAPFALWLQDLSSKDPYYILPVLMGASMLLQFRLNPTPMEPMQQKIMTIMPIMMTFLFITFPSGLVLYWVVNNILSIAQQWTINKTIGKEK